MEKVSLWLYRKGFIEEENIDYMRYALELIMSEYIVTFIIYIGLCFCGYWIEASIHLILFTYLRNILGGYHSSTIVRCAIISSIMFVLGSVINLNNQMRVLFFTLDLIMCLYYTIKDKMNLNTWALFLISCVIFIFINKIKIIDIVVFTTLEVIVLKILKEKEK